MGPKKVAYTNWRTATFTGQKYKWKILSVIRKRVAVGRTSPEAPGDSSLEI
jgi:hypothetical protein